MPLENDLQHVVGNKIFAIETNIEPLRQRIKQMNSITFSATANQPVAIQTALSKNNEIAKECEIILQSIERSLEEIKESLAIAAVEWEYKPELDTWVCGSKDDGCGVYEEDGKWMGNATYKSQGIMIEKCDSKEQTMVVCLKELFRLREIWGN